MEGSVILSINKQQAFLQKGQHIQHSIIEVQLNTVL